MNLVRFKRLTVHFFFSLYLLIAVTTPVLAVTVDMTKSDETNVMPLTKQISLKANEPQEEKAVSEEKATEPTLEPTPTGEATEAPTPTTAVARTTIAPTATPTPTQTPTTQPAQAIQTAGNTSTGGLNADVLFSMSNNYRAGLGLPPFQTDPRICSLAAARAPQISAEISGGYMHAGKDSHGFPYWFTENIIEFRTEAEAFNWWVNDHIHRVQIEAPNTHSCVACSGNACVQHFTSFRPK